MRSDIFHAIIIHNDPETVQELETLISKLYPNANIELLKSIEDDIKAISFKPDIAFLAEKSNSSNQFEICTQLRSILGCENIPIVFLNSTHSDRLHYFEFFKNH